LPSSARSCASSSDAPDPIADLRADVPAANAERREVGLPDPDATQVLITVQVQCPAFDPAGDELVQHWLVALRTRVARDWTWDGLGAGLTVERDGAAVGVAAIPRAVSGDAIAGALRDHTEVIFFDVVDPKPDAGSFPDELHLRYKVGAQLRGGATAEPPLPIDPEPLRAIAFGQSDDRAGQDAMLPLVPSSSPVHYLLPLPPGVHPDSPELFGFFSYELRVGHRDGWSTARGRFARRTPAR
jgi:hypothetical protein